MTANQVNIETHDQKQFSDMLKQGLTEGGIHLTASKGFGKSRLLFSMAQSLRNLDNCKVYIFDGSEAWLYGYSRIPVFNVNEEDIQLSEVKTTEDIETYSLNNWQLVKLALQSEKDILFRLKTRKPSKRGFFIRQIINYLDSQQRTERELGANHEPKQSIAYFIEESQDAFNNRSQTRLESEEFLTVFNEARNQREAFFTASQRLNDFSKTIRTKQVYCLGRINPEDRNPAIRAIEKLSNVDLSKMPLRNWFYQGETFVSPEWTQSGKPYIINRSLRAKYQAEPQPKKMSYLKAFAIAFFGNPYKHIKQEQTEKQLEEDSQEDSELDGLMSEGEIVFPPEE